jgi:hypothetical protein
MEVVTWEDVQPFLVYFFSPWSFLIGAIFAIGIGVFAVARLWRAFEG